MDRQREGRLATHLDGVLAVTVVLLILLSAATLVSPSLRFVVSSEPVELVVNTIATGATLAVSLLAWIRYQEGGQIGMVFQAAAFMPLAWQSAVFLGIEVAGLDDAFGLSVDQPSQVPLYASAIARLAGGLLLLVGGVFAFRRIALRKPTVVLLGVLPSVIVVWLMTIAVLLGGSLPPFVPVADLENLAVTASAGADTPRITLLGAFVQSLIGLLFLGGAAIYRILYVRGGPVSDAYLSLGLVVAAFSQLHVALYPGSLSPLVTTGEVLRVAFYCIVLLGVEADARAGMRALRAANVDLGRLREAEVAAAALHERARLAREIHDGLAQDLWFAKLKASRLVEARELEPETRDLATEVVGALDSSLVEAREAVMAMRSDGQSGPLVDVVGRFVDDFSGRFSLPTEFATEGELPRLPAGTETELMRILQEALNNIRKHADATLVRVRLEGADGQLRLLISDNGRGFDQRTKNGGFGLQSMRERAELLGGTLAIDSRPSDGTRLAVAVPFER